MTNREIRKEVTGALVECVSGNTIAAFLLLKQVLVLTERMASGSCPISHLAAEVTC